MLNEWEHSTQYLSLLIASFSDSKTDPRSFRFEDETKKSKETQVSALKSKTKKERKSLTNVENKRPKNLPLELRVVLPTYKR